MICSRTSPLVYTVSYLKRLTNAAFRQLQPLVRMYGDLRHIGYAKCLTCPPCFKHGIVIPAYKGKGRNPLLLKSYHGITLTSVFSNIFETLLLNRMSPILEDAGIPQSTQTAYRGNVAFQIYHNWNLIKFHRPLQINLGNSFVTNILFQPALVTQFELRVIIVYREE